MERFDVGQMSEFERERRSSAVAELVAKIGRRYAGTRLDNFRFHGTEEEQARQRAAVREIEAYGSAIDENVKAGRNLVLFGPCGVGKDHLAAVLIKLACWRGHTVRWENGAEIFGQFRDGISAKRSEAKAIKDLALPSVLCISDPVPQTGAFTSAIE
jgi:DNA replication protein DnaC